MNRPTSLIIGTWNLEWAEPGSARRTRMHARIRLLQPDVMVFTETVLDPTERTQDFPADPNFGYAHDGNRRKVLCWVRDPSLVTSTDTGSGVTPSGRFVRVSYAGLTIDGWCIPWRDAHVRSGQRDRQPWEDHQAFLTSVRSHYDAVGWPDIIAGDFNQRLPRHRQPDNVFTLLNAMLDRYHVATMDVVGAIDHIAVRTGLLARLRDRLPKLSDDGHADTDHEGYIAEVTRV